MLFPLRVLESVFLVGSRPENLSFNSSPSEEQQGCVRAVFKCRQSKVKSDNLNLKYYTICLVIFDTCNIIRQIYAKAM